MSKTSFISNNINRETNKDHIVLVSIVSLIILIGIVAICSCTPIMSQIRYGSPYKFIIKHLLFIFMGISAFFITGFLINYKKYQKFNKLIYWTSFITLFLPFVFGHAQKGAHRWISLGPVNFQPSELAKIAIIIIMADFLSRRQKEINNIKYNIMPALYFLLFIAVILCQKDLGTVILLAVVCMAMFFVAGISFKKIFAVFATLISSAAILIIMYPYRLQRIKDFKNAFFDVSAASYNIKHAMVAFGSGGFNGKGPGQSEMKLLHLPEMHTDFIFPIIGEEYGFLGTTFVISLFIIFMIVALSINKNCKDSFGKYLSLGITVIIISQVLINMAMTISLFPAKGFPLPFISYGGSSMIISCLMVGILFNIARSNNSQL